MEYTTAKQSKRNTQLQNSLKGQFRPSMSKGNWRRIASESRTESQQREGKKNNWKKKKKKDPIAQTAIWVLHFPRLPFSKPDFTFFFFFSQYKIPNKQLPTLISLLSLSQTWWPIRSPNPTSHSPELSPAALSPHVLPR